MDWACWWCCVGGGLGAGCLDLLEELLEFRHSWKILKSLNTLFDTVCDLLALGLALTTDADLEAAAMGGVTPPQEIAFLDRFFHHF